MPGVVTGNVKIGAGSTIRDTAVLSAESGKIRIGKFVSVNPHVYIGAASSFVQIGDGTSIAPGVVITSAHHKTDTKRIKDMVSDQNDGITIGKDCLIGANSVVQFGARIPDGAIVGAMGLVTRASKLEEGGIYYGRPVKKVGQR